MTRFVRRPMSAVEQPAPAASRRRRSLRIRRAAAAAVPSKPSRKLAAAPAPEPHAAQAPAPLASDPFASFWMAGFESACHINCKDLRVDMIAATQHDVMADDDYANLPRHGFRVARDSVRWHLIDRHSRFDFSSLAPQALAAKNAGVQVIWNLMHYGLPDGLGVLSPDFTERFARFCRAVACYFASLSSDVPIYAPINEISFLTWSMGDGLTMKPHYAGRGWEIKRQLVRAVIAGMNAIWEIDPRARFVHTDPIIHVVAPLHRPEMAREAAMEQEISFQAWDMIAGRLEPELGGSPRHLDILGCNFYANSQWDVLRRFIAWHTEPRDPRWMPLHQLLIRVHERYHRPLILAETSHVGVGRARWLREIAAEVALAQQQHVNLRGVCLYPILDRHDWVEFDHWHHSGLWDLRLDRHGHYRRVLHPSYARELARARQLLRERAPNPGRLSGPQRLPRRARAT